MAADWPRQSDDEEPQEPADPVLRETEHNERRALRWLADQVEAGRAADIDLDAFALRVFGNAGDRTAIGRLHDVLGGSADEPTRLAAGRVVYAPSRLRASLLAGARPAMRGTLVAGLRRTRSTGAAARDACLWGVFKLGGESAFDIIAEVLPGSDEETRFEIVRILGFMGDRRATQILVKTLWDEPSAKNRSDVLWALGTLADPAAVQACVRLLGDDDAETRGYAAWALGRMGDRDVVPALRRALDDPDPDVRSWVRAAILMLGGEA